MTRCLKRAGLERERASFKRERAAIENAGRESMGLERASRCNEGRGLHNMKQGFPESLKRLFFRISSECFLGSGEIAAWNQRLSFH